MGARPNIGAAVRQARSASSGDGNIVIITKKDREETLVTVDLEHFMALFCGMPND